MIAYLSARKLMYETFLTRSSNMSCHEIMINMTKLNYPKLRLIRISSWSWVFHLIDMNISENAASYDKYQALWAECCSTGDDGTHTCTTCYALTGKPNYSHVKYNVIDNWKRCVVAGVAVAVACDVLITVPESHPPFMLYCIRAQLIVHRRDPPDTYTCACAVCFLICVIGTSQHIT